MSELEHYGVKGMKWGVRKDRVASTRREALVDSTTKSLSEAAQISASRKAGQIIGSRGGEVIGAVLGGSAGAAIGRSYGGTIGSVAGVEVGRRVLNKSSQKKNAEAFASLKSSSDRNKAYSDSSMTKDLDDFGADGLLRINKSMNNGKSLAEARKSEKSVRRTAYTIAVGTTFAGNVADAKYGSYKISQIPKPKKTQGRGYVRPMDPVYPRPRTSK